LVVAWESRRACDPVLQPEPDSGRSPRRASAPPRALRPRGAHRTTPPVFPRRDSSRAPSHRRTIIPRFLAASTSRFALGRGDLDTQELAKVELARILTDGGKAVGDLGRGQGVLISEVALDVDAQRLTRSRQLA